MSQILNTSTDYLLDLTDNQIPSDFFLKEEENSLISNYRNLYKNNKIKVESYVQAIIDLKKE